MTDSANPQQFSDGIGSDFDRDRTSAIKFSYSNQSTSSSDRKKDDNHSPTGTITPQSSIEILESLSSEGVSFQQNDIVEQYRFEQYLNSNTFSLSPNLTSLLTPAKQQASCSKCGQEGCACSSSQTQPNQQDDHSLSSEHNHYHGDTSHPAHGLEGDFPVWNTAGTSANIAPSSSLALGNTFQLHSNPNAQHTIYLDFDGHTTSGTWWNNGGTIRSSAYDRDGNSASFSTSELLEIQSIWQQVAEDFAPFNVNVTTQDPGVEALRRTSNSDSQWGVRVLLTENRNDLDGTAIAAGAGGIAYIGSFNRNVDQPVFVFNKGARAAAVTASHEVGHSLYLRHDGISGQTDYHPGHGSGDTSWGTIMGVPFQESLTQWSKGEYYNANNTEDDLALITTRNGFGYRSDDHGNSQASASSLVLNETGKVSTFGIIERNTDVDYFSFTTGTGNVSFDITPASRAFVANGGGSYATEYLESQGANLDIWAGLYNASGTLVESSNPSTLLSASFDLSLTAGTYFIRIDGVGKDNPLINGSQGYSDYGSLGQYSIEGEISSFAATELETAGTAALLTTSLGYQVQGNGAEPQFVRFNGEIVSNNSFGGWSAIGVEQLGQGYQLLWKNANGQYSDWRLGANGAYQSSQSLTAADIMKLEPSFQQDLNGDQRVGATIEAAGTAALLTTSLGYQVQGNGANPQFVRFNGAIVSSTSFGGWSAIGVEKLGQGYQLLWKNTNGQYSDWRLDANGTYQSSQSITEVDIISLEPSFQQDLNGDQQAGATIEAAGTATLMTTSLGYQVQENGTNPQFVRLNGEIVGSNSFGGWSAIGVEKLGQGYRLLWKNTNGQYSDWRLDANGTYQSSQSITEVDIISLEPSFQQDLNGDQQAGATIEAAGTATLMTTSLGYQVQENGANPQFVRLNGEIVGSNSFGGWSAIGVEKLGQGYRLLWKNTNGRYSDWQLDAKGNYQNSQSITEADIISLEPSFQQDLNGDQSIEQAPVSTQFIHDDMLIGKSANAILVGVDSHQISVDSDQSRQVISLDPNDAIDIITDFAPGIDIIQLSASGFGGNLVGNQYLEAIDFGLGASATTPQQRFLYDQVAGHLSYDIDGNGSINPIHIATFSSMPDLSHRNIYITI